MLVKSVVACYNKCRKKRPMTASFRNYVLFFNNRSLRQKLGGYFFCIAKIYPVATINKRIAPISDISAHPLSGERYRRRIAPAQDVSVTVYYEQPTNTNKFSPVAALHPRAFLYRMSSQFTTFVGFPSINARTLSAVICMMRSRASFVAHEICGVMMQFGACRSGFSAAIGSVDATSTAA